MRDALFPVFRSPLANSPKAPRFHPRQRSLLCPFLAWAAIGFSGLVGRAATLEESLQRESPIRLAADAVAHGDAKRGAILFYQPYMACRKCHAPDAAGNQIGPDLTKWDEPPSDEEIVEAVLWPSKKIRRGYETQKVRLQDGRIVIGLLVDDGDPLVLRDATIPGKLITIPRADIEERQVDRASVMPAGLTNQLAGRQQFLDLVRYLLEIRDGGLERARDLEPAPHLYAARPIPEYENHIDHRRMIRDWDRASLQRGRKIYEQVCQNCHGTLKKPGSLPTALRFAEGQFKNGSDPYSMYQTLTRGFGMMLPQSWMVPQQKYDVIHYIREAYLRPHNPAQYVAVSDEYLASLPEGDTRGPAPQPLEPWRTMNYGLSLINTYEIGSDGSNFAYKGIAVRLDAGPGGIARGTHWAVFDHDTMRLAGVWTGSGFIDWEGIHFNGKHGVHPRVAGEIQVENKTGPGWANPKDGSWTDVRLQGRDGRRYGPLPRDWAHYRWMARDGNRVVVAYRVGSTDVWESPVLVAEAEQPVYGRQFRVGPHPTPLTVQVAQLSADARLSIGQDQRTVLFGTSPPASESSRRPLAFDGSQYAEIPRADDLDMTNRDFTIRARFRTRHGGTLFAKTAAGAKWVPDGKTFFVRGGRVCYDIGWVGVVQSKRRVDDGNWHTVELRWRKKNGNVTIVIDGKVDVEGTLKPQRTRRGQLARIGFTAPNFPRPASYFEGDLEWVEFWQGTPQPGHQPKARWETKDAGSGRLPNTVGEQFAATVHRGERPLNRTPYVAAGIVSRSSPPDVQWSCKDGRLLLTLAPAPASHAFTLWFSPLAEARRVEAVQSVVRENPVRPIDPRLAKLGSPPRYSEVLLTEPIVASDDGPFAVDVITHPADNPWLARTRFTGFDFLPDGDRVAICSWDGDVWIVTGIDKLDRPLQWQRIASGLFQPLGLKVRNGQIFVTCRDQIVRLVDLNGDREVDQFVNFNNDHQVTDHFHEFAMGLQTDQEGNFYYAKSARHALPALVPHHGTLLKVTADGGRTDIVARGFRAANGVCLNGDGTFLVTDQEGHWTPKNRINWVEPGGFYGNMMAYHDVTDPSDAAMDLPLCWITNDFDRSPSELVWVPSGKWGPLGGALLSLSYGYGKVFTVMHEEVNGQRQGALCELPLPQFPTGLVRGRFHPRNGHFYTCGMVAWGSNQPQAGGFYRIRATGKPMHLPLQWHVTDRGIYIEWTDSLQREAAMDPQNYRITVWDLKRSANYGSKHLNERRWEVKSAALSDDGRRLFLEIPDIEPTWGLDMRCYLKTHEGVPFQRRIDGSIYQLAPQRKARLDK